MGTRGAYGVIIDEVEKIAYGQFDAYPTGYGVENLQWLRQIIAGGELDQVRATARECRLVSNAADAAKPTPEDIERLKPYTNLTVNEQSTDDWYCLTRETQGSIEKMLACGYILDMHDFPLDSLFCEWAYMVDLDRDVFEVYKGFQQWVPTAGRWAGRPTAEEDAESYKKHLVWCAKNDRDPWQPEVSEYKAIALIASYPFDALPTDEEFLALDRDEEEVPV